MIRNVFYTPICTFEVPFRDEIKERLTHLGQTRYFDWNNRVSLWTIKDKDPYVKKLHDFYLDCAASYCNQIFSTDSFTNETFQHDICWINVYPTHVWTKPHNHRATELTGTYYVSVPTNSGSLFFIDPRPGINWIRHNGKDFTENMIEVTPKEGELIMFPGWLMHYVDVNNSKHNTISVSCNINTVKES